jgi:CRISPR-associated protein Csm3
MKQEQASQLRKWIEVVSLNFKIVCVEGCRIGGGVSTLEIGGLEPNLTVIRTPLTGEPYLPGSSLKGKLRSVLEKVEGKSSDGNPCSCGKNDCLICVIFGAHKNTKAESSPTRIVVRDAYLSEEWRKKFEEAARSGSPFFEEKTENIVNRKTGAAEHPRTGERVPPGTVFDGEIILHIYEGDNAEAFEKFVRRGLKIIEEASSLGASGSRGYGKVQFKDIESGKKKLTTLEV